MALFKITNNTTVSDLKDQFKNQLGGTLLIYYNNGLIAKDNDNLLALGANTGEVECRSSRTVGKFVELMKKKFNIHVMVATCEGRVTVLDGITLATIQSLPKQCTETEMEEHLGYQRKGTKLKKVCLNLYGEFWELRFTEISPDQQALIRDFVDSSSDEEIRDLVRSMILEYKYEIDGVEIYGENEYSYLMALPERIEEITVDGKTVEIKGEPVYEFVDIDKDLRVKVKQPKNCPEWLKTTFIKQFRKIVEKVYGDQPVDEEMTPKDVYETVLGYIDSNLDDLTVPNFPWRSMLMASLEVFKGNFDTLIEIKEGEKFDPEKFKFLYFSTNEIPHIDELDAIPLSIIYDDTFYDLDCQSGDTKYEEFWIIDPEDEDYEPLWEE